VIGVNIKGRVSAGQCLGYMRVQDFNLVVTREEKSLG